MHSTVPFKSQCIHWLLTIQFYEVQNMYSYNFLKKNNKNFSLFVSGNHEITSCIATNYDATPKFLQCNQILDGTNNTTKKY